MLFRSALALGLPTLADELDSYAPYADYFCKIRTTKMSSFFEQLDLEKEKITIAQKEIVPRYMPESLFQKWQSVLLSQE